MLTSQPRRSRCLGISLLGAVACLLLAQYPNLAQGQTAPSLEPALATEVTHESATIDWTAPAGADPNIEVTLFYGIDDGKTEEADWQFSAEMSPAEDSPGAYRATLGDLEAKTSYAFRVRMSGPMGSIWSPKAVLSTPAWQMSPYLLAAIIIALLVVPFYVGGLLAKRYRMPDHGWKIGLILCTVASGLLIVGMRWPPNLGIDLVGGTILIYEVAEPAGTTAQKADAKKTGEDKEDKDAEEDSAEAQDFEMDELIAAINKRVNPGGEKEMTVRPYGSNQVEIHIPRVSADEAARVEGLISRAGTLEFRILANVRDHKGLITRAYADDTLNVLFDDEGKREAWWVPVQKNQEDEYRPFLLKAESKREIAVRESVGRGESGIEVLVVQDRQNVTGKHLSTASVGHNTQSGAPEVKFRFDATGSRLFGLLTGANLPDGDDPQAFKRQLGIILDDHLCSAPNILERIEKEGVIKMGDAFTAAEKAKQLREVEEIVQVLKAGSLPASLVEEPIQRMVIGGTLGHDTIVRSCWAIGVSAVLVLIFMLFYYRFAGIVASLALLINLVLILAVMITIKAAFTLPGLAGLVLTLGMSVDANILVFERIREELARGAALRMAIRNGFARATTTIVDANLTTLITGIILFVIGSDQVKGFALTLSLGVVMSMYTAVFCSRVVFEIAERRHWITKLSMARLFGDTQYDFLGKRRLAITCSTLVIVAGLAGVVARGRGLLDIDFTGGVSVVTVFDEEDIKIGDIRETCSDVLPDLAAGPLVILERPEETQFWINTSATASDNDRVAGWIDQAVGKQLDKVYGAAAESTERTGAFDAFREEVAKTLLVVNDPTTDKPVKEETLEAAVAALRQRAIDLFADAPDGPEKTEAINVVRREVDRMARINSATEYVEEYLHQQFLGKLATNVMSVESLAAIEAPAVLELPAEPDELDEPTLPAEPDGLDEPEEPAAPESTDPPATPDEPEATDQGRADLPGDDVWAMADSSLVMWAMAASAQAEGGEPEETAAGEVAQPEEAASEETPAEGAAIAPAPAEEAVPEEAAPEEVAPEEATPEEAAPEDEVAPEDGVAAEETASEEPVLEEEPAAETPEEADAPADEPEDATEAPVAGPALDPAGSDEPAASPTDPVDPTVDVAEPPVEVPRETPVESAIDPSAIPTESIAVPEQPADRFAGGTLARLSFTREVSHNALMGLFASEFGGADAVPMLELTPLVPSLTSGAPPVQVVGFRTTDSKGYRMWDVKIVLPPEAAGERLDSIKAALADTPYFPTSNTIGSKVAGGTQMAAIYALLASMLCLVAYIWIRFQRVVFGLAAVVALVHDVLVTLGAIALSAYLADYLGFLMIGEFKIGLTVLAAFLTIIGYSLNDTIVVFDRIREVRGKSPVLTEEMINTSVNQTLSRTVLTAVTTFIVVLILYLFGGEVIHTFAFSLVIGVIVGTYSSIYIASPVLLWMIGATKGVK